MSPLDRFLHVLRERGSRGSGTNWTCPAHPDTSPSLSVTQGEDGRVLVKCHKGCSERDVAQALGLTVADLFAPDTRSARPMREVASYVYEGEDGEPLTRKVRLEDGVGQKTFYQEHWTGTAWRKGLGKTRRVLYNLRGVMAAIAAGVEIWLVEGEKDADALIGRGIAATTQMGGSNYWRQEYSDALAGAKFVHIVADKDRDGGGLTYARSVGANLRNTPHRIVMAAAGKDAYDHLAAGHGMEDFVVVPADAKPTVLAEVAPTAAGIELFFQDDLANLPEPEWYLDELLPKGETGMLFGPWGSRKSLLALDWANRVAIEYGLAVYVTPEGFRGVKRRWTAWREYNGVERVERLALVSHAVQMRDPKDVHDLTAGIKRAAAERDEPVALIIIDTLARSNAGGNENSTEDMTAWLDQADLLRLSFGDACTLLVVHHDGIERGRPRGSSAIAQWVTFMHSIEAKAENVSELRVEKMKDSDRVAVRYGQHCAADSVVLVEESREARDDSAPRGGSGVDAVRFAAWLAECGGVVTLQHAADQFGKSGKTIRRWTETAAYHQQGIRVEHGQVVLASSRRVADPSDGE